MNSAADLCEEILIEILEKLPTKSLVRSMTVCKLWKSIITSPQFRLVSKRPTKLLVTSRACYTLIEDDKQNHLSFETDFPNKYSYDSAVVIGSDNGLLCIGMIRKQGRHCHRVIIWNPFIRKHVVIPDHHMDDKKTCSSDNACGFGCTISGRDYKYVRILGFSVGEGCLRKSVQIYSLNTGTWRRKYLDWDYRRGIGFCFASVLLRGRLHWICAGSKEIFSFDLENEVFDQDIITVPESIRSYIFTVVVSVINESLAVIANATGQHSTVWVMEEKENVKSWIKLFVIDRTMDRSRGIPRNMAHLLENGEVLLGLFGYFIFGSQKLVTYNPRTRKTSEFGVGVLSSSPDEVWGFTSYHKENLVLLGDHRAVADREVTSTIEQSRIQVQPLMCRRGYYPVSTGGAGFHWYYPLFQDQFGSYFVWTGFKWLQIIDYKPFLTTQ